MIFFKQGEGWSLDELIKDSVHKTKLVDVSLDEIWVDGKQKGEEYGCDLEAFLKSYTKVILKGVCNVLKSFEEEK